MSSNAHALAFTGGTFTMGYVTGEFLKKLSGEYATADDKAHYLYPLYDIRHVVLAASIDASAALSPSRKTELYTELVETAPLLQELLLAKKLRPATVTALEDKIEARLNVIADSIEDGLTTNTALQSYGIDQNQVSTPYFIDSINYDERTHDEKLYEAARHALQGKKNETFFIVGGTDSQVMYAGKLTRRLIDEGIISEATGNKVIFLSAMKSFGYGPEGIRETPEGEVEKYYQSTSVPRDMVLRIRPPENPHITAHPQYIGRLFRKAVTLAQPQAGEAALPPGGYLLCPQDEHCHAIGVHDVRESMKVYYKWVDAFRSKSWYAAVIEDGQPLKINPDYHPVYTATTSPDSPVEHVAIAPPLINGNSNTAVLNYLQKMRDYPVMIIGGIPTAGTANIVGNGFDPDFITTVAPSTPKIPLTKAEAIQEATLDIIRERAERGVPTYYVNPDIFDVNTNKFHSLIPTKVWESNPVLAEIKNAGGILLSGNTTIGTYHNIQRTLGKLGRITGRDKILQAGGSIERPLKTRLSHTRISMAKGDPIGIEYIPDTQAFEAGFRAATALSKDVVISALPDGVLPSRVAPLVKEHAHDHRVIASYEYTHAQRRWLQHTQHLEGINRPSYEWAEHASALSDYAPAQAFSEAGGHDGGIWTPSELLCRLQHQNGHDPIKQMLEVVLPVPRGGRTGL